MSVFEEVQCMWVDYLGKFRVRVWTSKLNHNSL